MACLPIFKECKPRGFDYKLVLSSIKQTRPTRFQQFEKENLKITKYGEAI
jgi:predicted SprT family Zn-dependent metalloprotease